MRSILLRKILYNCAVIGCVSVLCATAGHAGGGTSGPTGTAASGSPHWRLAQAPQPAQNESLRLEGERKVGNRNEWICAALATNYAKCEPPCDPRCEALYESARKYSCLDVRHLCKPN